MFKNLPEAPQRPQDSQSDEMAIATATQQRQPAYKLWQKLRDMDRTLKHPQLSRKERRRARGETDPRNFTGEKVQRGRKVRK